MLLTTMWANNQRQQHYSGWECHLALLVATMWSGTVGQLASYITTILSMTVLQGSKPQMQ